MTRPDPPTLSAHSSISATGPVDEKTMHLGASAPERGAVSLSDSPSVRALDTTSASIPPLCIGRFSLTACST
eukprot:CAMPEP_0179984188 /NCGR_PEP_ID=MMETSP0984-20121128/997_1 /TAXON_ID=483367 /ORGANISM="non described non described, Strain CCMP 2436" /LENGTH=71 /DNA_ID=CAMNT_0021902753 /DNA_START=14 /DNA_END=229 /DNA_ORIENTATION=+